MGNTDLNERLIRLLESVCSSLISKIQRTYNLDYTIAILVVVYLLEDLTFTEDDVTQAKIKANKEYKHYES